MQRQILSPFRRLNASRGIAPMDVEGFIRLLVLHAEIVPVASFTFDTTRSIPTT